MAFFENLGSSIDSTVSSVGKTVGSWENKVKSIFSPSGGNNSETGAQTFAAVTEGGITEIKPTAAMKSRPDLRARLRVKSQDMLTGNILSPLVNTGGIMFPYTPSVSYGVSVSYNQSNYTHTNYKQLSYQYSNTNQISITAIFTSQTIQEAQYTLAVWHFLNVVTKSYFGYKNLGKAGVPPPILLFDYMGTHMFNMVPVVVSEFSTEFPTDVDYVFVDTLSAVSKVPVQMSFNITVELQMNPDRVRKEFDLDSFRTGGFIKGFR
jgi:hypothetical protein